ncbi:MAG: hypothetical protein ACYTKD_06795 [Planctomycetota bacterium]|jgi:hypothetical protein
MADQPAIPPPREPSGGRASPKRWRSALRTVIPVTIVVGVLAGFLYSALAAAREWARRENCQSCLKCLLYVCQLYTGDNEERFPSSLSDLLGSYVPDGEILLCPSAGKATELKYGDLITGADLDSHTDFVYVSGLTASDPPDYVIIFEDEWNHDGEGVNAVAIGGWKYWTGDINALHEQLRKQERELAARGREMRLIRPAWSSWPDPSASADPRAGPKGRPWCKVHIAGAVLVGALAGPLVAAFVFVIVVLGKPGAGRFDWPADGPPPEEK